MIVSQQATSSPETLPKEAYAKPDSLIGEFACRGVAVLSPETLGLPLEVHRELFSQEMKARDEGDISTETVPAILEVLQAPGLVESINQLVGENWAIVPFTHNAAFESGAHDQMWHKDDNGPYNARKQRYHQSIQLEMLYYPQDVNPEMGPTAIIPYGHYWTFNHEENQDNFAGADHLDFHYMTGGMESKPVSGPRSKYSPEDIKNATTAHDNRMRDTVKNTGWPLVTSMEAAPLKAGSVVLYSHNTFHRGNHRRDDHNTWKENPRFMWRFFIYRTTDSFPRSSLPWDHSGMDPLTGVDLSQADEGITECWRYNEHWMSHGTPPIVRPETPSLDPKEEAEQLFQKMLEKDDPGEATRIGAAYLLASLPDREIALETFEKALYLDRENVRRAASYGLVALGEASTSLFLKACASSHRWIRKAGVFGLGSVAPLRKDVVECLCHHLHNDISLYVRSVSADALGNLLRRASSSTHDPDLYSYAFRSMLECVSKEKNRLTMDRAQNRSIKYVRPTDDQDVCEGGAKHSFPEPYQPVRSIVKENLLWSLVMICSQKTEILGSDLQLCVDTLLHIVKNDSNIIATGFAMDALARLVFLKANLNETSTQLHELKKELLELLKNSPALPVESLICAGMKKEDITALL